MGKPIKKSDVKVATAVDKRDAYEAIDKNVKLKKQKTEDTDVKMKGVSPGSNSQSSRSEKTLFVGNLSFFFGIDYDLGIKEIKKFFKKFGKIVDVRLASAADGSFKGFGHVEFATEAATQKALRMNHQKLRDRPLRLELAQERGSFTPHSWKDVSHQSQNIFVKGFDRSLGENEIRSALEEHFAFCGEITRVAIPKEGIAYLDFNDEHGLKKAMELNDSDLGGYTLTVDIARRKDKIQVRKQRRSWQISGRVDDETP